MKRKIKGGLTSVTHWNSISSLNNTSVLHWNAISSISNNVQWLSTNFDTLSSVVALLSGDLS